MREPEDRICAEIHPRIRRTNTEDPTIVPLRLCLVAAAVEEVEMASPFTPLGEPGLQGEYRLQGLALPQGTTVKSFTVSFGQVIDQHQWMDIRGDKADGRSFSLWLLARSYPPRDLAASEQVIARYVFQEGNDGALEFRDAFTGRPVLPCLGAWPYLLPRPEGDEILDAGFPDHVTFCILRRKPITESD